MGLESIYKMWFMPLNLGVNSVVVYEEAAVCAIIIYKGGWRGSSAS